MSKMIQQYWQKVRETERTITEECPLMVSLNHPEIGATGGVVVSVTKGIAAELFVKGTHRMATDEEIESHRQSQRQHVMNQAEDAQRRAGIVMLAIPEKTRR